METPSGSRKSRNTGLALGLLAALAVGLPLALGAASWAEGRVYDLLLRLRSDTPSPLVHLVCIDDGTFRALGDRNPNRSEIARAIVNLWAKGPSLIAMDLFFTGPAQDPKEDEDLERALSTAEVVLACNPAQDFMPLPRFETQSVGVASVDFLVDSDGILRSLPQPYVEPRPGGGLQLGRLPMALECARLTWFPKEPPAVRLSKDVLFLSNHSFPIRGRAWRIPFCGGDGTLPRLSFKEALKGGSAIPDVAGKVLLIGSVRPSQHDYFSVPLPRRLGTDEAASHAMAGVEIHGQALSALLKGESIVPLGPGWRLALFGLIAAVGTALIAYPLRPLPDVLIWIAFLGVLLAASVAGIRSGLALPLFSLGFTLLFYAAVSFSYHRYCDFMGKRAVERLFRRYVSPNIAKKLLENPDLVHLGGRRRVLTILFSDVRGFTSLSERIPPEQVSGLLNEYFTEMVQVLFKFDGTLDKFIGDAILGFFGDPVEQLDHPARALSCAVAMQEVADSLRKRFRQNGKPELHVGIAVHAGPVVVGNNGSVDNFVYTVIGDTVNLTSRLQGLAQRDDVILTKSTAEMIPGFKSLYEHEEVEPVRVKGKAEPIEILRVIGRTGARAEAARASSPA
jgi:adenylate cyclase